MTKIAIRAEGIGKRYRIGERERYSLLRDAIANAIRVRGRDKTASQDFVWAVREVSFEIQEGEVVGLIGRNGAGKTTLLKLLARITRPTTGHAEIHGRVGSLLEVGTGFHPELTGRENIYLSGAILGMSKKEIERKFDEIVAFAEVERFIDTPLKHFSSGMQMRLAFAVAAHLEPEILLVDEVLAVGDLAFQKRCLGKMSEISGSGRTIVFISHQMNQIRRLCPRAIWLDGGEIRQSGPTAQVVGAYESAMFAGESNKGRANGDSATAARFLRWEIDKPTADSPHLLSLLEPVRVLFELQVTKPVRRGHHGIALFNSNRELVWAWAANNISLEPGSHCFSYSFPMLPLRPGVYAWQVSLWEDGECLELWDCLPEMIIATENYQHPRDEWNGVLNMPCGFRVEERVWQP